MMRGSRKSTLARVMLGVMLSQLLVASAWGWGGSDESGGRGWARRRRGEEYQDTAEEYDPEYDGYVEEPPSYRGRAGRQKYNMDPAERRRSAVAEMNKMRSRSRDEMTSDEYTN